MIWNGWEGTGMVGRGQEWLEGDRDGWKGTGIVGRGQGTECSHRILMSGMIAIFCGLEATPTQHSTYFVRHLRPALRYRYL